MPAAACLSCKLCVPELSHYRDFRNKYTNNDIKYPHNCKAACKQFSFSEACLVDSEQQQCLQVFHRIEMILFIVTHIIISLLTLSAGLT